MKLLKTPPMLRFTPSFQATFDELVAAQWRDPNSLARLNARTLEAYAGNVLALVADMSGVGLLSRRGELFAVLHVDGSTIAIDPTFRVGALRYATREHAPALGLLLPRLSATPCPACAGSGEREGGCPCRACHTWGASLLVAESEFDAEQVACPICMDWSDAEDEAAIDSRVRAGVVSERMRLSRRWHCFCRGRKALARSAYPAGLLVTDDP